MTRRRSQHGSELVEAAFVLPIIVLVLLGIFEFGRAYQMYHTLTDAAREGARYSVAPYAGTEALPNSTDVTNTIKAYLAAGGITAGDGDIQVQQQVSCDFNGVTTTCTQVTVQAVYQFLCLPQSVTLKTVAVMRNENN